jgi:arginine/lysine/ornithine decarboxylase
MDYARFYLENYGESKYEKLLNMCSFYREKINTIEGIYIAGKEDIKDLNEEVNKLRTENNNIYNDVWDLDATRYVINLDKDYSGHLLLDYLKKFGIQAEMSDTSNVVLIFSPFNEEKEFESLYNILKNCSLGELKQKRLGLLHYNIPEMKIMPYETIDMEKEYVDLSSCLGRVSAENIVPYPPGVPILAIGELIDKRSLEIINYYRNVGVDILGIQDDKLKVIV